MLMHLSVKNIALIDEINLDFDKGFNIMTGETGAGKSIIIDAVNLILGERADRDLIQTGKKYALVEAIFDIGNQTGIGDILCKLGIEMESDGTLLLMRELTSNGRNICRINGRIVTLSTLRKVGKYLIDIHGQHQHQSLLNVEQHQELLDMLGGDDTLKARGEVETIYNSWKEIQRRIKRLSGIGTDGERRKDLLIYQINEIESANLRDGEEEELNHERAVLVNSEKIIHIINSVYQNFYTGSNIHPSVTDLIGEALSGLNQIAGIEPKLDGINEKIESLSYLIEDIVLEIRNYKEGFEYNPLRLDVIEKRLEIIRTLKRKYGADIPEVLGYLNGIKKELEELENSQEQLEELRKEEEKILGILIEASNLLSKRRKATTEFFEKQLLTQLSELGMEKSNFHVNMDSIVNEGDTINLVDRITPSGYDRIEFLISTNPGEPVKPLSKIVSGGEMSRIMLAFKTILAQVDDIPTLIFDEIDVGISGRIAHVIGEKMGSISRTRQVICVTHLPQIAAMADVHYKVQKEVVAGHTRTTVRRLDEAGRQEEIAKMSGGKELTRTSMEHALELIQTAWEHKNKSV
ncbi:MAG: DNA repair protein RecN [Caldicoprobacterales bacterium]|jgi:DNA repair protein RecN (Recombination protein N)